MASGAEPDWADVSLSDLHRVRTVEELGEVLRRLRRRYARRSNSQELTVRELARRCGYAYGVVSEYLSGKALPPTDRFDVLVGLLGASTAEQQALATARDRVEEHRRARRAGGRIPRELPPDVYGFTGRAAEVTWLDQLLGEHRAAAAAALICAIAGTAGVGKTALAVHWAHRVWPEFPDGCLYADLRGYDPDRPVRPTEVLGGFLRSLGADGADVPHEEAERAARYRTLLADRRMLVLLDNARDTEHVRPLLPGGPGCVVLVTSRDALTGLVARHGARRIRLDPLAAPEAVELLHALIGERVAGEANAAAALAARCVRLPLTLRLVAELAATRPEATLAELDAELADVRHRLDRLDAGGEPRTAGRAVFSWSYQNLAAETARAFRLIGLYPGHDLDQCALAALAGTDLGMARSMLKDLTRAHLVQPARMDRYETHDLLRAYAAELAAGDAEPERRAAMTRLLDHQLHSCSVAMDLIAPFDRDRRPKGPDPGWPMPQLADATSAIAWLDAERANLIATAVHAADHGWPGQPGRLGAILVRYLDTGAHYHDAEVLHAKAATADPAGRAHALISLGIVCWRQGRYQEAADHHERALDAARQTGDRIALGRALTGLGIVYWQLGRMRQTLDCGRQAVELYRDLGDRIGQARVLGNLGIVHRHLGNYAAAVDHHRQSLGIFREVGDPVGVANELCSVGVLLEGLGRPEEAVDHLREALALARRAGYRETEAQALDSLGVVYRRLGRFTEALEHHHESLGMLRQIGDRAAEGYALGHLGSVHERLGQYADATDHHHRALRIARELGDDHLTAESLNRLGDTLVCSARTKKALRMYQQALAITSRTGNRYQQARAHHGIARALSALGDGTAAVPHWERAMAGYTELGVPEADEVRARLARPVGSDVAL